MHFDLIEYYVHNWIIITIYLRTILHIYVHTYVMQIWPFGDLKILSASKNPCLRCKCCMLIQFNDLQKIIRSSPILLNTWSIYVRTYVCIFTSSAFAPFDSSKSTTCKWPFATDMYKGVLPSYKHSIIRNLILDTRN